jgi:hypothetical protein
LIIPSLFISLTKRPSSLPTQPVVSLSPSASISNETPFSLEIVSTPSPSKSNIIGVLKKFG